MNGPRAELEPLDLPYWPTCDKALTWSADNLAVAVGEVVHILTPRYDGTGRPVTLGKQWHNFMLRVNQFAESEWPYQTIATLDHYSIGEELSESTVIALSWSPTALGLYRRSVLAILTSNLVLSFWETNGKVGVWQRTGIVNQYLEVTKDPRHPNIARHQRRIRTFLWLPRLTPVESHERSTQILVVADDDFTLTFKTIQKTKASSYGEWSMDTLGQHRLKMLSQSEHSIGGNVSLRQFLAKTSPISSLEATEWRTDTRPAQALVTDSLTIKVSLGQCSEPRYVKVDVESDIGHSQCTGTALRVSISDAEPVVFTNTLLPLQTSFEAATRKARAEFDQKFGLNGAIRVRNWGAEFSPDKALAATCVSLHPSDMVEYGSPASQHTLIVFVRVQGTQLADRPAVSEETARKSILEYLTASSAEANKSALDQSIIANAIAIIESEFKDHTALANWAESVSKRAESLTTQQPAHADPRATDDDAERSGKLGVEQGSHADSAKFNEVVPMHECCTICDTRIPLSRPLTSARCERGHQFTRCSLTFVAIQEPGISMSCAKCGRQFLDPSKVVSIDGPSLSRILFDKFDVCPYCQGGRFRG